MQSILRIRVKFPVTNRSGNEVSTVTVTSTKASLSYLDWQFQANDCLVFGRETRGLPEELLTANWDRALTIPMLNRKVRSLNLATSVGIVLYEALRQIGTFQTTS